MSVLRQPGSLIRNAEMRLIEIMRRVTRRRREQRFRWKLRSGNRRKSRLHSQVFSCSKLGEVESTNADYAEASVDFRRITIADGISRSFRPREWARHLVRKVNEIEQQQVFESLNHIVHEFDLGNPAELSWPEKAVLERYGSQATLLTVSVSPLSNGEWSVNAISVGDCLLVVVPEDSSRYPLLTWPFSYVDEFPSVPGSICSLSPHLRGDISGPWTATVRAGDRLLIMSDALARYFVSEVRQKRDIDQIFPFLSSPDLFKKWATHSMSTGLVEEDDLTVAEVVFT